MYGQTLFNAEPLAKEIPYGPSTIIVNKLVILFGSYQYGQESLDVTVSALGDWYLDGELKDINVPYINQEQLTLGKSTIDNWGTSDDVIINAVFNHYGFTRKQN